MSNRITPFLRLCRLPTVFTALADISVGYLLTHLSWHPAGQFTCLLMASAGLYLSGMVFNDVFDLSVDREERPRRPLPSGQISLPVAILFGGLLMGIGITAAALVSKFSLLVAIAIAVAIFLYDGLLKKTPLGPIAMGSCRFLNVLLGASSAAVELQDLWNLPQIWHASAMGIYIVGVTWFARKEAGTSSWKSLLAALIVVDLGLAMLAVWMGGFLPEWGIKMPPPGFQPPETMLILLGAIALTVNRRAIVALSDPTPGHVQVTIGTMLISVISLDAMVIFFHRGPDAIVFALLTLLLIFPAIFLRRAIPMT